MSIRRRLILGSFAVLAVFSAAFAVLAIFTVRQFVTPLLLQNIDENLDRQTTATLLDIYRRQEQNLSNMGTQSQNRFDTIFYTVLDINGKVQSADRNLPINADLVARAADRQTVFDTLALPDGSHIRVILKPITYGFTGPVVGVLQAATPLGFFDQTVNEITIILVVVSVVLLALGALGSYLLTGSAFRVVERITRKVRQIELSQDLSQRLPEPGSDDEVGNLVGTFNRLLARLEAAFDTQRRFVADSSHELRTPLTVIRSNLHLLRQTHDAVERADLLNITEGEVSRLNRMVNDLLYMAQVQAGHDIKPVLRPVELDGLLLDVFARARPLTTLKRQKIALTHEDIAATMGDREQLQHLLLNLLDNAVKYTGEGGLITLGLWNDRGWARIEITDNGPGIAEEDLPLIFDRFYRTQDARQAQRSGSGLGLAIVKSIAESHGGKIEVFSRQGEGTTFRLWLRLVDSPHELAVGDEDTDELPEPEPVPQVAT
jgi:two-component system, OmpR family, sensor kinase